MIMPAGQPLLLPVKPWFIALTVVVALLLNFLPDFIGIGRQVWLPDWLALVLVFWAIHEPLRIGMAIAFVLGLVMDVHQGTLLGQHALIYVALVYTAIAVQRRLQRFSVVQQTLQVFPLFLAAHALGWLLTALMGRGFSDPVALLAPVIEMLLWPLAHWLLLAPQRRPPDPDKTRPL